MPNISFNLLDGMNVLANGVEAFRVHCIEGIEVNRDTCRGNFEASGAAATILNPIIGYKRAGDVTLTARRNGTVHPRGASREGRRGHRPSVRRSAQGGSRSRRRKLAGGAEEAPGHSRDDRFSKRRAILASDAVPTGEFACEVTIKRIRGPEFAREEEGGVAYLVARDYEIAYETTLRFVDGSGLPVKARLFGELNKQVIIRDPSGAPVRTSGYVRGRMEMTDAGGRIIFRVPTTMPGASRPSQATRPSPPRACTWTTGRTVSGKGHTRAALSRWASNSPARSKTATR